MKKCSYCGHDNADDAERCRECGTSSFAVQSPAREGPKHIRIVRLCQIAGGAVIAYVLVCHFELFSVRVAQSKAPPPGWDPEDPIVLVSWVRTLIGVAIGSVLFWVASLIRRKGKPA
jgi:hypothetical protein